MSIDELKSACERGIAAGTNRIMLVVPGPAPRGETVRLCRTRGPKGVVVNWHDNATVAAFDAKKVLAFITGKKHRPAGE